MTEEDAREQFSDYLEEALSPAQRDAMQAFLAAHPDCAAELIAFERTLALLHRLPPREPSLDLWREFAPRLAGYQTERRQHLGLRVAQGWAGMVSQFSAGVILWTHALAGRTHARLERYLIHDPLHHDARRSG